MIPIEARGPLMRGPFSCPPFVPSRLSLRPNTAQHLPSNSAKIKLVKKLAILGSTGSIGHSTLSICESFPDRYQVISLAAGNNIDAAFAQCLRWRPKVISLATEQLATEL